MAQPEQNGNYPPVPPPVPSPSVNTAELQSNQLTLDASDDLTQMKIPDISWLEKETKESRQMNRLWRLKLFLIHLNLFILFYITSVILHYFSKGICRPTDPIRLDSQTFSILCEFYRISVCIVVIWMIFAAIYWVITIIIGISKIFLAKRFGSTTMFEILLRESSKMEFFIHYTLISVTSYIVSNWMISISLADSLLDSSSKVENFKLKEIIMNLKGHFFSFSYPKTLFSFASFNAFFSSFLLIERIFIRKFAINFHYRYFQDRIQTNTFLISTLDSLRNQFKKMRREIAPKGIKKASSRPPSRWLFTMNSLQQDSKFQLFGHVPSTAADKNPSSVHNKIATAIFTFLTYGSSKHFVNEDNFSSYLPESSSNSFFKHITAFTNTSANITKQQFIDFVVSIYEEKENLLKSINDQEDLIRQLHAWFVFFIFVITLMVCLPKLFLVIFPVAYMFDSLLREDLEELIEAGIFVFVKHPFDVGDTVMLDGINHRIVSIDFMTTTLYGKDADVVYMKNSILNQKIIHNIRRSGCRFDDFVISLYTEVDESKFDAFQKELTKFVKGNPNDFKGYFKMWGFTLVNSYRLDIVLTVEFVCNRHSGEKYNKVKNSFLLQANRLLQQIDIPIAPNQYS